MQAAHAQDLVLLTVIVRDEQRRGEDALQVVAEPGPRDVRQRPGEDVLRGRVTLPRVSRSTNSVNAGTAELSFLVICPSRYRISLPLAPLSGCLSSSWSHVYHLVLLPRALTAAPAQFPKAPSISSVETGQTRHPLRCSPPLLTHLVSSCFSSPITAANLPSSSSFFPRRNSATDPQPAA